METKKGRNREFISPKAIVQSAEKEFSSQLKAMLRAVNSQRRLEDQTLELSGVLSELAGWFQGQAKTASRSFLALSKLRFGKN